MIQLRKVRGQKTAIASNVRVYDATAGRDIPAQVFHIKTRVARSYKALPVLYCGRACWAVRWYENDVIQTETPPPRGHFIMLITAGERSKYERR